MTRFALLLAAMLLGAPTAQASTASGAPQAAFGGGVGFMTLLHLDYRSWVEPNRSIEFTLTPLLMLNVGVVSFNKHVPLSSSASAQQNLVVSGTVTGLVGIMDGSPAFAPGVRAGYEVFSKHRGVTLSAGAIYLIGSGDSILDGELAPDLRLTVWRLKRENTEKAL